MEYYAFICVIYSEATMNMGKKITYFLFIAVTIIIAMSFYVYADDSNVYTPENPWFIPATSFDPNTTDSPSSAEQAVAHAQALLNAQANNPAAVINGEFTRHRHVCDIAHGAGGGSGPSVGIRTIQVQPPEDSKSGTTVIVGDDYYEAGSETRFVFWPEGTFDSRSGSEVSGIVNALNSLVDNVNYAKEGFLLSTTNYSDISLTAEQRKQMNYFAGNISPNVYTQNLEAMINLIGESGVETLGDSTFKMDSAINLYLARTLRPLAASTQQANNPNARGSEEKLRNSSKQVSVQKDLSSDKMKLRLYRLAREVYEAKLSKINDVFFGELKKIQERMKTSVIIKSQSDTQMIVALPSKNSFSR